MSLDSSIARAGALLLMALLVGCAMNPAHPPRRASKVSAQQEALGNDIADDAMSLLGRPYRYGGADLEGFDCSGLLYYVFSRRGVRVPRTVAGLYRAARPVPLADLIAGDLLFFKIDGAKISHVALYAGQRRFVHAPQSGRQVELRTLDDAYYGARLVGAGRLL